MCISSPWYLIMVPDMKKIHPDIMEECLRTERQVSRHTERKTDWRTRPIPIFPDCAIADQGIISTHKWEQIVASGLKKLVKKLLKIICLSDNSSYGLEAKSIFQCLFSKSILALVVSQVPCLNVGDTLINHMIVSILQYTWLYQWQCCSIGDCSARKINNWMQF